MDIKDEILASVNDFNTKYKKWESLLNMKASEVVKIDDFAIQYDKAKEETIKANEKIRELIAKSKYPL